MIERYRDESEPLLFGKGNLDLTDPSDSDEPDAKKEEESSTKGYGSIESPTTSEPKSSLWTYETKVTSNEDLQAADEEPKEDIWAEKEEKGDDESPFYEKEESLHERPGKPEKPKRHCFAAMFYTVESLAMITNLILLVSQVLPLLLVSWDNSDPAYIALKVYLCIFALILTVVELDFVPFFQKAAFLRTFVTRGFLYTFFGLVCFDEAGSDKAYKELQYRTTESTDIFRISWFAFFNEIAAYSLIAIGVIYFLMGIVCLQKVRTKYVFDDRKKWKDYHDALERWEMGV